MLLDGKVIAARILEDVASRAAVLSEPPSVLALTVLPDAATRSYLSVKTRQAERAGIHMTVREIPHATTDSLIAELENAGEDALIVQLPLPSAIDTDAVLAAIPEAKDADVLSPAARKTGTLLPPVAAAVKEFLNTTNTDPQGLRATVVGHGRLVGEPVAAYLQEAGAQVTVVTKEEGDLAAALKDADIIVSGAGVPGLITSDMIRPDAIVIDAGTSEQGGAVVGDADPRVADTATLTPVPGGVGPVAVACLLRNAVMLAERRHG